MSFYGDKKREHDGAAENALLARDCAGAFFHTAKAAEFGLKLAEQTDGKVALRYVQDAFELLDIAAELKAKARKQSKESVSRVLSEAAGGGAGGRDEDEPPSNWELQERPSTRLDDVAGLEEVKETLREKVIYPFQHPEVYERFKTDAGAGILMYGPPGNGKTYVARAIAGEIDAAFFPVDLSTIKSKYVGETAKNMSKLFAEAARHERAVLFLDEVDALLGKRGNRKVDSVAQFLALTDGLKKNSNCMLLLTATNKPWLLDEAVIRPGRLGTHIYVGLPDAAAREAIVALNMRGVPAAGDVVIADAAAKTEGWSGADMAAICDKAKMAAVRRQLDSGHDEQVTAADFAAAIEKVRPSVTPEDLAVFERWRDSRSTPAGAEEDD